LWSACGEMRGKAGQRKCDFAGAEILQFPQINFPGCILF
jgi:hypothetical protein